MAFTLSSTAFNDGAVIPTPFTCDGGDTTPPLEIANVPDGARSFALVMDDPDAPNGTFTHWLVYDIPASGRSLVVERGTTLPNDFGRPGYGGPCPPRGHGVHRYFLTVYALDVPSLGFRGTSRVDLEDALKGHTLATARLMGTYERRR